MPAEKVALVVGAGDYIGAAISRKFAREGHAVCMGRRNGDRLKPLADEIRAAGGEAHPFTLDARQEQQVIDLFARIENEIGPLFASAKFGLRALAQSMARELGPEGIHVAHMIIDAGVDTAWVRERIRERLGEDAAPAPGSLVDPDSIADAYWYVHSQPSDAWTFEFDLRPSGEKW